MRHVHDQMLRDWNSPFGHKMPITTIKSNYFHKFVWFKDKARNFLNKTNAAQIRERFSDWLFGLKQWRLVSISKYFMLSIRFLSSRTAIYHSKRQTKMSKMDSKFMSEYVIIVNQNKMKLNNTECGLMTRWAEKPRLSVALGYVSRW